MLESPAQKYFISLPLKGTTMTQEQINAVRCAYLDLQGALEARNNPFIHDWRGHQRTIDELATAFDGVLSDLVVKDLGE